MPTDSQQRLNRRLNNRERAILRAVAADRAELLVGCEPDLTVDGCWCDHVAVHELVVAGLIRPAVSAAVGSRVSAVVTDAGRRALSERVQDAA